MQECEFHDFKIMPLSASEKRIIQSISAPPLLSLEQNSSASRKQRRKSAICSLPSALCAEWTEQPQAWTRKCEARKTYFTRSGEDVRKEKRLRCLPYSSPGLFVFIWEERMWRKNDGWPPRKFLYNSWTATNVFFFPVHKLLPSFWF